VIKSIAEHYGAIMNVRNAEPLRTLAATVDEPDELCEAMPG
jgi:hypothetical protein